MNTIVVSVRTGVFCTSAGDRLLNKVLANDTIRAQHEDIRTLHSLLNSHACVPSVSEFSECVTRTAIGQRHDDIAREFEAMERIREAIVGGNDDTRPRATRSRSRMFKRMSDAGGSVVSETTNVGSVFSRAP